MLGTFVILYLFLGGCGAGVLCSMASWSLVFHRSLNRSLVQTEAFDRLKARCYAVGFVTLCVAALCLLLDLGRPDRAYLLFMQPSGSILSFGSFVLLISLLVGGFLTAANLFYIPFVHASARKVAEVVCVIVSVCMMVYTGVYVACVEAVALWNNVAIPALFALSSLSAGLSVVFISAPFVHDWPELDPWIEPLHRAHLGVLALESVALAVFLVVAYSDPYAIESLGVMLGSDSFGGWFVVVVVGMGVLIPLAVEAFMALTHRALRLLPVDLLCILGGLALRFCVIWSGMH